MLRRSPLPSPGLVGTCSCICAIAATLVTGFCPTVSGAPAAADSAVLTVNKIARSHLGSPVLLQGTVSSYKPPRSARSPHSFMLSDRTGAVRIVIWQNLWDAIPFKDKLKTDGQKISMRAEIAEWQGTLEGHLRDAREIALGTTIPPLNPAIPANATTPSPGLYVQPQAMSTSPTPTSATDANSVVLPGGVQISADVGPGSTPVKIDWKSDITEAQAEARGQGRKILIFFQVPGNADAAATEAGALSDSTIAATIALKYVPLLVNPKEHPGFKSTGVAPGSFAIYSADGRPEKTIAPVKSAAELTAALQ
jgi:hypothetical protein